MSDLKSFESLVWSYPICSDLEGLAIFWDHEINLLFKRYNDEVSLSEFVIWAIARKLSSYLAYVFFRKIKDEDPIDLFNALRTICTVNDGFRLAAIFFDHYLETPIYASDVHKKYTFIQKEERCSLEYFSDMGVPYVKNIVLNFPSFCCKHDRMVFSLKDAYIFEKMRCPNCKAQWSRSSPNDTHISTLQDAVDASGIWLNDLYYKIDSYLTEGKHPPEVYDRFIEMLQDAYCPPGVPDSTRFRGIGEVLIAKGDEFGAIKAFEHTLEIDRGASVKRKLKALYDKLNIPDEERKYKPQRKKRKAPKYIDIKYK